MDEDIRFMKEALKEAQKSFEKDEVPVGAVLVYQGRIIGRGHNEVEVLKDATAHAEMICLTAGSSALDNWRLSGCTLYCTLEPCAMCAGAVLASRLDRLVWGAPDIRVGANGSWVDLFSLGHPIHTCEIKQNVLRDESAYLLKTFFEKTRKKKREPR